MDHILVTGGAGNIGSALVKRLLDYKEYKIIVVDNLSTGKKSNLPQNERLCFIKADVNDYNEISSIFFKYDLKYVFHFAAVVGVSRTLKRPIKVLRDIDGIRNVLRLCKNTGVERVFYASSSEVYGEPVTIPQNEYTTPLNSRLPYAIVKNLAESYLKSFKQEYDLDYTILRFFNTYGASQSTDFVIPKFIKQSLKNEDITIYGDGDQTRTFCFVDDNTETIINILKNQLEINDVINIGSNIEYTINDLAELIIEITKSKSKIIHLAPLKEGDMTRRKPDITKMKKILKRDLTSLKAGIQILLKNQA